MPRVYSTAGHLNWGRARARARTRAPHAGNCLGVASGVERSDAGVDVVADSIAVRIGCTRAATDAQRIEHVPGTVAIAGRDAATAACIDRPKPVAYAAGVERAHAGIDGIADAVIVGVAIGDGSAGAEVAACGEEAGAVGIGGGGVEVASGGRHAPRHLIDVADPVVVGVAIGDGSAGAEVAAGSKDARAVGIGRGGVEVAGGRRHAPWYLIDVADTVVVGIAIDHGTA